MRPLKCFILAYIISYYYTISGADSALPPSFNSGVLIVSYGVLKYIPTGLKGPYDLSARTRLSASTTFKI